MIGWDKWKIVRSRTWDRKKIQENISWIVDEHELVQARVAELRQYL